MDHRPDAPRSPLDNANDAETLLECGVRFQRLLSLMRSSGCVLTGREYNHLIGDMARIRWYVWFVFYAGIIITPPTALTRKRNLRQSESKWSSSWIQMEMARSRWMSTCDSWTSCFLRSMPHHLLELSISQELSQRTYPMPFF